MKDARVDRGDGEFRDAAVVAFDARDDVAVLRVAGLGAPAAPLVDPVEGQAVAILGYPENGPFTATPGRIGQTAIVLTDDAYGRGPVRRRITTLRGVVRHGNSGGPGGRRPGPRAGDDLRVADRLGRRLRRPAAALEALGEARSAAAWPAARCPSGPCVR